jgi:hypothetical protein
VSFVLAAQNPYLGWGDAPRTASNTSMTVWAVAALKSAKMAELQVDSAAFASALAFLDTVTDPGTGRVGYETRDDADRPRPFPVLHGPALTAGAVCARILAGQDPRTTDAIQRGADLVLRHKPSTDATSAGTDVLHRYFGSLALFQVGGTRWKQWNESMKTTIVDTQFSRQGRDERGSWDPTADGAGRLMVTVLNNLCLEVYYRYGRVFGASNR